VSTVLVSDDFIVTWTKGFIDLAAEGQLAWFFKRLKRVWTELFIKINKLSSTWSNQEGREKRNYLQSIPNILPNSVSPRAGSKYNLIMARPWSAWFCNPILDYAPEPLPNHSLAISIQKLYHYLVQRMLTKPISIKSDLQVSISTVQSQVKNPALDQVIYTLATYTPVTFMADCTLF